MIEGKVGWEGRCGFSTWIFNLGLQPWFTTLVRMYTGLNLRKEKRIHDNFAASLKGSSVN